VIRIQQTRSPSRRPHDQRLTLIGLRLNRIGRIANVLDTPAAWGMIRKVRHLIKFVDVDEALLEEHRLTRPQPIDEAADIALMRRLVFDPHKITLKPFS